MEVENDIKIKEEDKIEVINHTNQKSDLPKTQVREEINTETSPAITEDTSTLTDRVEETPKLVKKHEEDKSQTVNNNIKNSEDISDVIQEDSQEQSNVTEGKKKRKKSLGGLILTDADQKDHEETKRGKSSRTAAALAKSKLSSQSQLNSRQYNRSEKKEQILDDKAPLIEWVLCDSCKKWRSISIKVDLPEIWNCSMNFWSDKYNTCSAPEETEEEAQENALLMKKNQETNLEEDRGDNKIVDKSETTDERRGTKKGHLGKKKNLNDDEDRKRSTIKQEVLSRDVSMNSTQLNSSNSLSGSALTSSENQGGTSVNWVNCDSCKKWRKVPESIDMKNFPIKWYCSLNTWNAAVATCSAPQEQDDEAINTNNSLNERPIRGAGKTSQAGRKKTSTSTTESQSSGLSSAPSNSNLTTLNASNLTTTAAPLGVAIKETNWVCCERKNCKKWRKVPAHIDSSSFPDKWYCEMNTWNPSLSSCSAPEESASEDEGGGGVGNQSTRGPLLAAQGRNNASLSYRRILYGNDGKLKTFYSDKNKQNVGLFSLLLPQPPVSSNISASLKSNIFLTESQRNLQSQYDTFIQDLYEKSGATMSKNLDSEDQPEPYRKIRYWWSTSYDSTCQFPNSISMNPSSSTSLYSSFSSYINSIPASTSLQLEEDERKRQQEFEENQEKLKELERNTVNEPTYLLDSLKRISSTNSVVSNSSSSPSLYLNKYKKKYSKILSEMTLLQRQYNECCLIRSCFLSCDSLSITWKKLLELIEKNHFLNDSLEACRLFMSKESLRLTLKKLEDMSEIEVNTTRDGQLIITRLVPLEQLSNILQDNINKMNKKRQDKFKKREEEDNSSINTDRLVEEKFLKSLILPSYPLKMRKFLKKDELFFDNLAVERLEKENDDNLNEMSDIDQ